MVFFGAIAAIAAWAAVAPAASPPITIEEAAACLGLSAQQIADVRAGKIVSTDFQELSERELAITVAMLVKRPIADIAGAVRGSGMMEADPNIMTFQALGDGDVKDADFAGVAFSKDEASELHGLLTAKRGTEFNLSAAEIARFESVRARFTGTCDAACAEAVTDAYRAALAERLRAYRSGGTNAIAPYARSGEKVVRAGDDLRAAAVGCALVHDRFPDVVRAFVDYPEHAIPGITSRFFWAKQHVQDRPAFLLVHRLLYEQKDAFLGMERQFYVGHSYNCLLIMSGCLGLGGETLVFYINRTSTDQVAGFPQGTRHSLGRRHMRAEIIASLEKIRAKYERPSP
ncbi:MAG TPA: hypothetical protein VFV19_07240 [Candidatus Polarisedimenticolaceae bacterium]|nr:hypothetical protein [Candidatus Polarisedimenticolaceae bacterium]